MVVQQEAHGLYSYHRVSFVSEDKNMAKKTETKKKKDIVTYRGQDYTVLEREPDKLKLTDGLIHFWAKAKDVEEK